MGERTNALGNLDIQEIRFNLKNQGFWFLKDAYPQDFCNAIIEFINNYKEVEHTEINYAGTELRIWQAEKKDALLNQFCQESNDLMSAVLKKNMQANTLLAIRNKALTSNDTTSKMGRWHIDSFRSQLKTFLFLNETTESSGPLEFLPKTHHPFFKLNMLLKGKYFKLSNIFQKEKRLYQSLDEKFIENLTQNEYTQFPFICSPGTLLLIDTSAIHRARPCLEGARYALTGYY